MPQNLTDFARAGVNAQNGVEINGRPPLRAPAVKGCSIDFPDEELAIFGARCDDTVIVRRPVGIEDRGGVGAGERKTVWEFVGEARDRLEGRW